MWGAIIGFAAKALWGGEAKSIGELIGVRQQHRQDLAVTKLKINAGQELTAQEVQKLRTQNMRGSLKDEWFVLVLSLPWLSVFIGAWWPSFAGAGQDMIALVGQENYAYYLGGAIMASFGLRWRRRM